MQIPKRRPFYIAILSPAHLEYIDPDGPEEVHLGKIIKHMNSLQKLFFYELVNIPLNLGNYDQLHNYSNRKYFTTMGQMLKASGLKNAICIVSEELDDSSFNKHNKEDWNEGDTQNETTKDMGLGVITIEDYKTYVPKGTKLEQYLAFLILCESFCIVSRHHLEHSERAYCLFDMCHFKRDLILSIRKAYIHEQCIDVLTTLGFSDADIADAYKILDYVRRPNKSHILKKWLNDSRFSIPLGMILGIITKILTEKYIVVSEIIIIVMIVVLGVFIISQMNSKHK